MPAMYGPLPVRSLPEREGAAPATPEPRQRPAARMSAPKPHICFVAPSTWPILSGDTRIPVIGGAELQQTVVATELARRGYRVSMLCLDYGQADGSVVNGITVRNLYKPDEGIRVVRYVHPRLTKLWSALKAVDADVYYQRSAAPTTGFMAAFCKRHGKRSIYAGASDVDFLPKGQDIQYARDRMVFEYGVRNVDRVFVQNPVQEQRVRDHYGREPVLIQNCFSPPPGARADMNGYVLWVATVRSSKRPEVFLEMARRMPGQRFVMIGGCDNDRAGREYARSVQEAAAQLPNVEYKGFLPFAEADRWFNGARVVLNTSLYEGFPNTFLQAWARGVPTLGFVDTGSRRDGRPVYDIVGDVAEATARLQRLMSNDIAWQEASRRVLAHFRETHSVEAVVSRYEQEFELLMARQ